MTDGFCAVVWGDFGVEQAQAEATPFAVESLSTVLTVLSDHTTNQGLSQSAAETLSVRGPSEVQRAVSACG